MQSIDMLSAFVIGGAGAFVGAVMMLIAMQGERSLRPSLRLCLWGFVVIGVGLSQNAFGDRTLRLPILTGSAASLVGTALIARGIVGVTTGRVPRRAVAWDVAALTLALLLAWPRSSHVFALVFHGLSFGVALAMAWALRRALLAPRNAAESAVATTVAVYAATWAYGFWTALGYRGPELRHLMYMDEPVRTVYAVIYALMPLVVGALVLNLANARLGERLRRQASTDELTGLLSRRALHERIEGWQSAMRAAGRVPTLLMIDVDHFKRINDTFGHDRGDDVLRTLADRMRRELRAGTRLVRYGGEEFLALVDAASSGEGVAVAERLRRAVAASALPAGDAGLAVTISIGVAPWPADSDFAQVLSRADAALYRAKAEGRDRVVDADTPPAAARRAGDAMPDVNDPAAAGPGTP